MKTYFSIFSITVWVLWGITLFSALPTTHGQVFGAESLQKGSVTAGLAREMGIRFPEQILQPMRTVAKAENGEKSITPTQPNRKQNAILPVSYTTSQKDTGVVLASGEEPITEPVTEPATDPFLEMSTDSLTPMEVSTQTEAVSLPTTLTEELPTEMAVELPTETPTTQIAPQVTTEISAEIPVENSITPPAETPMTLEELSPVAESEAELLPLESAPTPAQVPENTLKAAEPVFSENPQTTETVIPATPAPREVAPHVGNTNAVIQGQGKPGNAELEGIQVARLTVEKAAPAEIQVGRASTWTITVRNEGKTDVNGVQIHDSVPQGTQLVNTHPAAKVSQNGEITWNVGNMPSGTMAVVKMELIPTREGEVGSIASVTCRSEASAKTVATRPLLKVETFGDAQILLGNQTELNIVVSNPGTGVARNVILSETVPPELQFEGGAELRYEVGDLQPGESKTTKLPLTAVRAGKFTNRIIARSEPGLMEESVLAMEVTAPAIELKLVGPSKRFLDKEGTYRLQLTNTGTAPAQNVNMKAVLPNGWKFVSANNFGTFNPENRATLWRLEELGAGDTAEAEVVVSPTEIGTYTLAYEATADICQTASGTKSVSVEGIAALMFQVVDSNDPIQVGEDTRYTVEVVNQGSKQAENVQIAVEIPSGLQVVASEEDVRVMNTTEGKEIVFAPVPTLGPKATKVYRFTLRGVSSGDQRVAVKLSSREFPTPIVKEESTRVFTE